MIAYIGISDHPSKDNVSSTKADSDKTPAPGSSMMAINLREKA